ncbi:hypothetical protein AOLI_G00234760 [Acnodon oligacanthus]
MAEQFIQHASLLITTEARKQVADRKRLPEPTFWPSQQVWLSAKDLPLHVQSKKLVPKYVGLFNIDRRISPVAYRLSLPHSMQIHPTFHVSCLGPFLYGTQPPAPSLVTGSLAYTVHCLLDSRHVRGGSAAVAFLSYTNLSSLLDPSLFYTTANTVKTMVSNVVSATLPKTINTQLSTPVNFTLKHNEEIDPNAALSCVYWNDTHWVVDGCELLQTNSSHSVCSCVHLSTFALIMQTKPPEGDDDSDPLNETFTTVAVAVGLVFLSLAILTFAVCRRNPRVTNTAQINLCISLLLAHLLFLLTQKFLRYIQHQQLLCAVLAGVLHFLFLSAFVWMFIEAVLLFIAVKNLTKIKSNEEAGLWGKWLVVIGYAVPLAVVGMSAGLVQGGYGSKTCWLKRDFLWSFLGPVSFILVANTILFIGIMIILFSILTNMKSEILRIERSESDLRLFKSVSLKAMIQFIILGCSWNLGFFTDNSKVLEIVFILLNSQQGTFIFLVHCVLNQEVSHHLFYFKVATD